jgi:hypothetical protein
MHLDLMNRIKIYKPSIIDVFLGWLGINKKSRRIYRMRQKGIKKVERDLDVLKILIQNRVTLVQLWSLLRRSQH